MCGVRRRVVLLVVIAITAVFVSLLVAFGYPETTYEVIDVLHDRTDSSLVYVHVTDSQWWRVSTNAEIRSVKTPTREPMDTPRTVDCIVSECFRIVAGELSVERSADGGRTYTTVWSVTGPTYNALAHSYSALGDPAIHLSSRSLVALNGPRGIAVFVADGRDGVLYRNPAGQWRRLGVPTGGEGYYWAAPARLSTDPAPPLLWPWAALIATVCYAVTAALLVRDRATGGPGGPASRSTASCSARAWPPSC